MKSMIMVGAFALALAGCATTPPQTTIAAFEVALTTADQAALVYTSLPECTGAPPALCSDPAVKEKIKSAAQFAYLAVKAAEASVAQGGVPDTATISAAINALQTLIPTGAK